MSPYGQISYILLQNTHIGSVKVTEQLMSDMRDVAAGQANADDVLHDIQQMIVDDRAVMLEEQAEAATGSCADESAPACREVSEMRPGYHRGPKRLWLQRVERESALHVYDLEE